MLQIINNLLICIAFGWLADILVEIYISRCLKKKVTIRKPFGCEKCMGFWLGLSVFIFSLPFKEATVYALLTSLSAILINRHGSQNTNI